MAITQNPGRPNVASGHVLGPILHWDQHTSFTDVKTKWPHFEAKWLQSLRHYLRDIGGQLHLQDHGVSQLQRVNDCFLMDVVLESKKFRPATIKRINYCRMYLNVLLLSDITLPNGKQLDHAAYNGHKQGMSSSDSGHSVNQAKPNDKAWADWKRFLHHLCHRDAAHTLKAPLGPWTVQAPNYNRDWDLFYSPKEDTIYRRTPFSYSIHHKLHHDYDKDSEEFSETLPLDAVPIERKETPHTWRLPWTISTQDNPQETDTPQNLTDSIPTLQPWERMLLQEIVFLRPETHVWAELRTKQCFIASDGSAPPDRGSFAWILSNPAGERLAKCNGPVFGHSISSYRAEGYGMLSFLRFYLRMTQLYWQPPDRVPTPFLVCDNLSLVKTITKLLTYANIFPNTTLDAEWDCIAQILQTMQVLKDKAPALDHIKGHQDSTTPYEELTLSAQLNCDADTHATKFLQEHPNIAHQTVHQFPAGECNLKLQPGTITRDIKLACAEARNLPALKQRICDQNQWWTDDIFEMVDWTAHGQALKRHEKHRPTMVKYIHNILPVGKQVHRYDPKYPPNCPTCNAEIEDMKHFWSCKATSRLTWRRQFLRDLKQHLIHLRTGPQVRDLLMSKLRAVLDGEDPTQVPEDPSVTAICATQTQIRWDQLLCGRFAKEWNTHHRTQPGSSNKHTNWTTEVVDFILTQ